MKTVGILGGGQLGLMLANSIYTCGADVIVYDPDPSAPLCRHAAKAYNGSWTDYALIEEFVRAADIVTYEFENVECAPLRPLAQISPIYPGLDLLAITQNRISEKRFLKENRLPHVRFATVEDIHELEETTKTFPLPFVIKTARGGYDGKGQYLVRSKQELAETITNLKELVKDDQPFSAILEEFITVSDEVSCIVARELNGKISTFPVLENHHRDHILDKTIVPAGVPVAVRNKVKEIAEEAALALDVQGLLTTEFFLSRLSDQEKKQEVSGTVCGDYLIYINEFAPRPHNSGHITRNACHMSQFDALARILLEIPLTDLSCNSKNTHCMINILGDSYKNDFPAHLDLSLLADHANVAEVVLYGKLSARPGRKMGHLVAWGEDRESAIQNAQSFKDSLDQLN